MADNWYVILELEFDPPIEDEQKIAERINEKAKFWSSKVNDFQKGPIYKNWLENVSRIKKDMIGSSNIRTQLAEEARVIVYGPVDKLLKVIGRKGNVTEEEIANLSRKLSVSVEVVEKRAERLGIKKDTAGGSKDYQATYDKYYKTKPQNANTYEQQTERLASFGVDNFYDFLYAGTTVKNANRLPAKTLCLRAEEKKKAEFYKHTQWDSNGSKLCGECMLTFKDETSKAIYDKYLEYIKRRSILKEAKDVSDVSGELTIEQGEEFIGQLTQVFRDRKLSEKVLVAFCKIEKITYNTKGIEKKTDNIKICRCGCINDISGGRKICSNCGLDLVLKCPECGTANDANIKVCQCGFKFENIDKALALCEQAEHFIETLDFEIAKAHISDANSYWPNSSKVRKIKERIEEFEHRVGKTVSNMRKAVEEKRYYEARSQYANIQKLFSNYKDEAVEQEISEAITQAQNLLQKAKKIKEEKEILELCAQAYELCADLPGVKELIPAPSPVMGFMIEENPIMKENVISWKTINDKSVKYVVVRSKSGWIQNVTDGEVIFRGSAAAYSDKAIAAGVIYYYNVFAERAGIYSSGAKGNIREAINLFEVNHVTVTASASSLHLMWEAFSDNAKAEIYEIFDDGTEKLIATSTTDNYLVSGLRNGTKYTYHVVLAYNINGQRRVTRGIQISGIPDAPPLPIDSLRIKLYQNDIFEAVWFQEEEDYVKLFCSANKPKYNIGDIVPVSTLEKQMRPLQLRTLSSQTKQSLKMDERGASFKYAGTDLLYVTAVVVKAGTAVFGSLARAGKGEKVNVKSIRSVNGQINIYIDAPTDASGFVVLYRFDQFPIDIADVKTVRKYIPLKQYQLNSALVLDGIESKKYYFSIFAEFKQEGDREYSTGAEYLFDNTPRINIFYSITVNKKLFGESTVVLEFESEEREFYLPEIEIMSAIGNTPMFKASAKLFYSIPAQHVKGSLPVKIPLPKGMAKDTYIKAFFKDEKTQTGNQLRIKLKSNYKIS